MMLRVRYRVKALKVISISIWFTHLRVMLLLIHESKKHSENLAAFSDIYAIVHIIHAIVDSERTRAYVGKHGGCKMVFFRIKIAVIIYEKILVVSEYYLTQG